jgi:Protein of unknown function (DUF1360)
MHIYFLFLGILGVWRITHLLTEEPGPGEVLAKARRLTGGGFVGQLMSCFYCASLWVAAPFAVLLGESWKDRVLLWPALSGAAILLERLSAHRQAAGRGFYVEEVEDEHVLR